jgi:hypothetical protein
MKYWRMQGLVQLKGEKKGKAWVEGADDNMQLFACIW